MPKQNPNKKSKSDQNQNSNSESPIRSIPEIPSPFFTEQDMKDIVANNTIDRVTELLSAKMPIYTIDDLIDVWCRGVTNGATLWQYCQDTSRPLPSSFEAGLIELVNEIRNSEDKPRTLQDFINNNMILLGVFDEKL